MKLSRIHIRNFRSIQDISLNIDPPCRVLVGINESGKSNILRALSLLSEDRQPIKENDVREPLPDEAPIDLSYVLFVFNFEKNETDRLSKIISGSLLSKTQDPKIVSISNKEESVGEFCAARHEGLYMVNILTESKKPQSWTIGTSHKLVEGWKKPSNACPKDFFIDFKGQNYILTKYKLIQSLDFPGMIPEEYLDNAIINDFDDLYSSAIGAITKDNLPNALFWEYNEDNLLPSFVEIDEFLNEPNSCPPLRNMFRLSGIDDIRGSIETARKGSPNQFQNYLDRVARKTTNHFRSIWKEYKGIEFSLRRNANQIIPGVKESNIHDFSRRSDGFKRFVTFLLMVSANVRTHELHDTLLLLDDPNIFLHPSSERYLRDELISISATNYVVYSTHSIFMIDSGYIDRHYIVEKKNEITSIKSPEYSNIADEELLYNALGHTIFSILKQKNLIFEGWKDKHLFLLALENAPNDLKEKFSNIGVCHAKGVSTIKAITPIIELAERECLIISDNDKPAKAQQKAYVQEKGYGEWKRYHDIDSTIDAITGEDFVKNDFIAKQLNLVLKGLSMPQFDETLLPSNYKLSAIFKWLTDNGMTKDQAEDVIPKIKDSISHNLKYQNIEPTYTKLLNGIPL